MNHIFCVYSLFEVKWDCKPLWKSTYRFLRELEIILSEDPAILLRGIYPKDARPYHKATWSTTFIAAVFVIAQSWKSSEMMDSLELYGARSSGLYDTEATDPKKEGREVGGDLEVTLG